MHYWGVSLEELLERYFASDDEAAMGELVRETRQKLLVVARRICGTDAEDAVQTAYLSLAKRGGLGGTPVLPWLLTAVARIAYRARATRAREHAIAERLAPSVMPPEPPEIAVGKEEAELLRLELWKLPPDYRDALQLRYLHGLSGADTARLLGINDSTLRTRLQRGRRLLRSRLARVLHPLLALPWLMNDAGASVAVLGGTMKLKLGLVAVLLAALGAFYATAEKRGAVPRAAQTETASRPAPEALPSNASAGPSAGRTEDPAALQPESVSAEERQHYLDWRKVGPVFAESRRLSREAQALFEELGEEPEEAPVVSDPVTAAYLRDLIREYRSLPAGAARLEVLQRIVETQGKYLAATHDASFLAFLEDVVRGSDVEQERELAVPEGSDQTLELLFRVAGHPDPAVRAAAIRSLAATEDPRAIDAVVSGLKDEASVVRWTSALELEYAVADPAHAGALLDRIAVERHPLAADGIVRAVLALDPEGGTRRVESAVAGAPDPVRTVVRSALRAPEPEASGAVPGKPAEAEEPRPDRETKVYLQRLIEEYRSLQGRERLAAVEKLADAHADYLERTDDASFLPILAEIARGSQAVAERVAVVRSFRLARDRRVVDLFVELKESPEASVRTAVAAALAWVRGSEAARAHRELLDLLADRVASVRIAVASLLGVPVSDPEVLPRLLAALRDETDVFAAYAMIDAIFRLDPDGGRARIDAAASASPSARSVIEAALRLRDARGK